MATLVDEARAEQDDGGNADEFAWMFRHGGPFWNLVGNATQPLFEGGTLLHRKRAAADALKQAAAQYQSSVITAYQNVADTLHASLSDADALEDAVETEDAALAALVGCADRRAADRVDGARALVAAAVIAVAVTRAHAVLVDVGAIVGAYGIGVVAIRSGLRRVRRELRSDGIPDRRRR